jgi:hypothetical protein
LCLSYLGGEFKTSLGYTLGIHAMLDAAFSNLQVTAEYLNYVYLETGRLQLKNSPEFSIALGIP